jgi:hypothetical protein
MLLFLSSFLLVVVHATLCGTIFYTLVLNSEELTSGHIFTGCRQFKCKQIKRRTIFATQILQIAHCFDFDRGSPWAVGDGAPL